MKLGRFALGIALLAWGLPGCAPSEVSVAIAPSTSAAVELAAKDALVQYSLLAALAAGDYAGGAPLRRMLSLGDFGIGTFSDLDGELILLDGKIYQALSDGAVRPADLEDTTPFAAVTFFNADGRIDKLAAPSLDDLDRQLDRRLPHRNLPYALRVEGEFAELTLRSVPSQKPPFQPLVDVVKRQSTWRYENVRGTLIGLRCPAWVGTLNVAGYHWHFLSDDRQRGGHVLACELREGSLSFDECTSVVIELPQTTDFDDFDVGNIKKQDIDEIERQRAPSGRP